MLRKLFLKSTLVFLMLAILFVGFPPPGHADMIPNIGHKWVDYGVKFEGIKDFPEYVFILYRRAKRPKYFRSGGLAILKENNAVSGFWPEPHVDLKVYAIEKSKFHENEISKIGQIDKNGELKHIDYSQGLQLATYFDTNKKLIPSDIVIKPLYEIKENDPRDKIIDVFKIDSIKNGELKISPVVKHSASDSVTRTRTMIELLWYIALPILALLAIIVFVLNRRRSRT